MQFTQWRLRNPTLIQQSVSSSAGDAALIDYLVLQDKQIGTESWLLHLKDQEERSLFL